MRTRSIFVALAILATVGSACTTASSPSASASSSAAESTPPESASPTPTEESTPTAEVTPTTEPSESFAADELNFSLDANFGETSLTAGFTPDPHTVSITSGGPIDVSYLGGDQCRGWATSAPDYKVSYTAGSQALLRFYFIPDTTGDTTLIINEPGADYVCADDTYGRNPSLDFASPIGGRYDIWVGSYESGAAIAGTLYVTELETNHP